MCSMPMSYPAKNFDNGWMISGFVTTTLKTLFHKKAYRPKSLELPEDYLKTTASYMAKRVIGGAAPNTDTMMAWKILKKGEEKRFKYFKDILKEKPADVVAYGTTLIDKMGHICGCSSGNSITRHTYKFVDTIVKDLIKLTDPDHVMICADHGFQGYKHSMGAFHLDTGGTEIKSIFNFAKAALENVGMDYEKDKYGSKGSITHLSDEEKGDIKDQLRTLGYL